MFVMTPYHILVLSRHVCDDELEKQKKINLNARILYTLHMISYNFFCETQTQTLTYTSLRRSHTQAHTHPYERTHAHPTSTSTSEEPSWTDKSRD
jgi:hypothetical protein